MKVTGVPRADGDKDYRIKYDGQTYMAVRDGSQFRCQGHVGTLKLIKSLIVLGSLEEPEEEEPPKPNSTWDHVDPCALLVLVIGDVTAHPYQQHIIRTLDCNGYLTETGAPDYKRAMHEYNNWRIHNDTSATEATNED